MGEIAAISVPSVGLLTYQCTVGTVTVRRDFGRIPSQISMSSPLSAKRVLKRQKTNAEFHYASDWLVMWTEGNAPVAVGPPEIKDGIKCIGIFANCKWLKKLCFNHATWQREENQYLAFAVARIRAQLAGNGEPASAADSGAAALLEGHSSEEEPSEPEAAMGSAKAPRDGRVKQWVTVSVMDVAVQVLPCKGHKILIEYTGSAVVAVCKLIAEVRRKGEAEPRPDFVSLLHATDDGRVSHNKLKRAFCVSCVNAHGKNVQTLFATKPTDGVD